MKRALKVGFYVASGMLAFCLAYMQIARYRAYRDVPPGTIVDYRIPYPIELIGHIGLFGLAVIALLTHSLRQS